MDFERGRKPWGAEMNGGRPFFEQSKMPRRLRDVRGGVSHSQQWSAMSPNGVTVGLPTKLKGWCSSMAERLLRKQRVGGSSPLASSSDTTKGQHA